MDPPTQTLTMLQQQSKVDEAIKSKFNNDDYLVFLVDVDFVNKDDTNLKDFGDLFYLLLLLLFGYKNFYRLEREIDISWKKKKKIKWALNLLWVWRDLNLMDVWRFTIYFGLKLWVFFFSTMFGVCLETTYLTKIRNFLLKVL